jgi:branched-chain amino acid transport system permease protein
MDFSIAGILLVDGLANGAIYTLLGLAIVLVFTVTRVIFIPQGEFVAYGALTLAIFQTGRLPGTVWLLGVAAALSALLVLVADLRERRGPAAAGKAALRELAAPAVICAAAVWGSGAGTPILVQAALTLAIVTALGPLVYRLAFHSLAGASTLVLLIVAVGVHFSMTGIGLLVFGAEGFRNPPFWDSRFQLGAVNLSGQTLIIFLLSLLLIAALALFFSRTLYGKALRATAVNRLGARLMGISTQDAGRRTFTMAAFIGALSGLLIGPTTTLFYDSGFLIGLKGFVAAVIGGLASYPGALAGALAVGVVEAFSSFWASAFKEVIVFTIILPVLLWRSLRGDHTAEEH